MRRRPPRFTRLTHLSLHDALPIWGSYASTHPLSIQRMSDIENRVREIPVQAHQDSPSYWYVRSRLRLLQAGDVNSRQRTVQALQHEDRKSTRLNSSP